MRRRLLILVMSMLGLAATGNAAHANELLSQILAAVSAKPLVDAPFFERRLSPMFSKPLESRGMLNFRPTGQLEKLTTSPIRERLIITQEGLSIQADEKAAARTIRFEEQPQLAGIAQSIRSILAGDAQPVLRYFEVRTSGSLRDWQLLLLPREAALKRAIRQISVSGRDGHIRLVETTEASGDVIELSLLNMPAAAAVPNR